MTKPLRDIDRKIDLAGSSSSLPGINSAELIERQIDLVSMLDQFGYEKLMKAIPPKDQEYIETIKNRDCEEVREELLAKLYSLINKK